ncbi:MAG: T9SS type A sorting domain-containing protein [Tannerella sp.]|nr:T9SS type A sorting domain-containing protein [Tannerella sp.]
MENPWYYYETTYTNPNPSDSHKFSMTYRDFYVYCDGSYNLQAGYNSSSDEDSDNPPHYYVTWGTTDSHLGGYRPAEIILVAGSHVRLTGISNVSIGADTHTNTVTTLELPTSGTPYTLMNDATFDAASIVTNGAVNGTNGFLTNSVIGINTQYIPGPDIRTNAAGGTILIGSATNTASQAAMFLATTTGGSGDVVGKYFNQSGQVYTGSYYYDGAGNIGNYGDNAFTLYNSETMFPSGGVGTRGWQIYAHNPAATCENLDITFDTSPITININSSGSFLTDIAHTLTYNVPATFNASSTGHTTLRAGNVVQINREHTYNGTGNSDYWVQAMGDATGYCGTGNIITAAGTAPVYAHNKVDVTTGHLKWEAHNNIETNSQVKFENDYASTIDWIAGNDILTKDTITFNNLVHGAGHTKWTAVHDIVTSTDYESPLSAENGVFFTHEGQGLTEWRAGNNIHTQNVINFLHTSTSIGTTDWYAGSNIRTEKLVTFVNYGTGYTMWRANGGNIVTGYGAGNDGYIGRVEFLNMNTTATNPYTTWSAYNNIITNAHVYFYNQTHGNTLWETDVEDIITNDSVTFINTSTANTEWHAARNINTKDTVGFTSTATATGNTDWWAGANIWTEKPITFLNEGTGYTTWRADDGDIITGYGSGNDGYIGRVDFQNLHSSTTDADTYWSAENNIITNAHINFNNVTNSDTKWQAHTGSIITNDSVTFNNTQTGNTDWQAYINITTNDTVVFTNTDTGNTKWWAETGNIETNRGTPGNEGFVTFNNSGATGANTEWIAGRNIFTNNVVTFNNAPAVNDAYIKWWAQTENIELNDSTTFNQFGTALTGTLRGIAHGNPGLPGSLWLIANDSILSERKNALAGNPLNEEPLIINYGPANNAPVMLHAVGGDVTLDGVLHVNRENTDASETTIEAGQNIHFLDTVTWFDNSSSADILLHAHQDILTNLEDCNNTKTAPIYFEVKYAALTRWIADRNLHTKDTVNFKYNDTGNSVEDLHLVAQGGNLTTDRWFNIDYDSDNRILFSAVSDVHPYNYAATPSGGAPASRISNGTDDPRHTVDGNIFLNDSVKITRTNTGTGQTDVLAKYNIRTAAVNYEDHLSTGNNTTVESYKGDIFLGYSMRPDVCLNPLSGTPYTFDDNVFTYNVHNPAHNGVLNVLAGYDDQVNTQSDGGGNIYFAHIAESLAKGAASGTNIKIPFSNEYTCTEAGHLSKLGQTTPVAQEARVHYEHAGIIGGIGACGTDANWSSYAPAQGPNGTANDTSLIYHGNNGSLLVDAGTQGNIIINKGAYLEFQQNAGNASFLTRWGNIDMRYPFDADSLRGGLLFLANSELSGKLTVDPCTCEEERNNVYLQDFQYRSHADGGSVFIGADNNIKLQYGGLRTIGTSRDPFFSPNYDGGYLCSTSNYHCDADTTENHARNLILNFDTDGTAPITKGGFAAVASDLIDVYKAMVYTGGQGAGMSAVPGYGHLHGENVSGYGLYIKTQANKTNYNISDFEIDHQANPFIGAACAEDICHGLSFLHQTARVTFHSDARIYAQKQKALITSPVLESYGFLDLNTSRDAGTQTNITIRTDSLIVHDSLIIDGPKTTFSTWSGLYRDMPILKLGHHRGTPPSAEPNNCSVCYTHEKDTRKSGSTTPLETLNVTFRNDAGMPRLHTMVADHAIITFLTDSFDHTLGNPSIDTKFFTDTFKVRNHVELKTFDKTRSGHFELISEEQMLSKNYAGIYTRHLHMEPIGPACSRFGYSQLWLEDPTLSVITSSIFGGFGWLHNDVYVEIEATLAPGYGSLGRYGNCYEQKAGILRTQNLRMDQGANIRLSLGESASNFSETFSCGDGSRYQVGAYADFLDVKDLFLRGPVKIDVLIRPEGLLLDAYEQRCFPILHYESVGDPSNLNNLQLSKSTLTSKDHPSIDGTYNLALDFDDECHMVSLCIVPQRMPIINREIQIHMPDVAGVTSNIPPGIHYVRSHTDFAFSLNFAAKLPLTVNTNRLIKGVLEDDLVGTLNENGEYEYVIRNVQEDIYLRIGPGYVGTASIEDGTAVWSHNNMLYIKVEQEDIASIYSIAGQLVKRIELSEGNTSIPLGRGVYVITLKDGTVHKVIIK